MLRNKRVVALQSRIIISILGGGGPPRGAMIGTTALAVGEGRDHG